MLKLKIKSLLIFSLTTACVFHVVPTHAESDLYSGGLGKVLEKEAIARAEEASSNINVPLERKNNDSLRADSGENAPSNEIREAFKHVMDNSEVESIEGESNE